MKYIILSPHKWNANLVRDLAKLHPEHIWKHISVKTDFTLDALVAFNPDIIFIPHWSYIIPKDIYYSFECIVFHMTDLPFGRGGSPLQNLIARGITETKISALRVEAELDGGPIYCKKSLQLKGSAEEIFYRANNVITKMITEIILTTPVSQEQKGEIVKFKRRTPSQSNLEGIKTLLKIYDHIRMLDAEGYPHAFLEVGDVKYEFTSASLNTDGTITADVRIYAKE
jgi:methionyl-tRNA formyltransferase